MSLLALQPAPGSSIAIFGVGSVGLSAVMAAKASGCLKIIAVDRNPTRLELARELGATDIIDANTNNAQETIIAMTGGGADYAIDTTAIPQVLRSAVDSTNTMGETAVVGGAKMGTEFSLDMNNMLFGRKLRGVVEGSSTPQVFIPQLIAMREAGRCDPAIFATNQDALVQLNDDCLKEVYINFMLICDAPPRRTRLLLRRRH